MKRLVICLLAGAFLFASCNQATSLLEELEAIKKEQTDQAAKLEELESENNKLSAENSALLEEIESLKDTVSSLKTEKDQIDAALEEAKSKLENSSELTSEEVTDLLNKISTLEKKSSDLQEEIDKREAEQAEKEKTIKSANYAKFYSEATGLTLDHVYVGDYDNFLVTSEGYIKYYGMWGAEATDMDTQGYIQKIILPKDYAGCIAVIKTDHHANWGHYRYPDYNEEDEDDGENCYGMAFCHHGCYVPFYVRPEGDGFYMAQAIWSNVIDPDGVSHPLTACASSLEEIDYLFSTYGYDGTCANLSSNYSRSVDYKGILSGVVLY